MSLPQGQYYCLYIIFNSGEKAIFHSRDKKNSRSVQKDQIVGLKRLFKLARKHQGMSQNISIYDHRAGKPINGELIWQMNRGQILVNKLLEV